ncbi:hypothetical protein ASL11_23400 [Paenibacillus sp. Soil750]|nr:hypothetical protein ASL11_23400 [Paenibacillus sp. Soil750]
MNTKQRKIGAHPESERHWINSVSVAREFTIDFTHDALSVHGRSSPHRLRTIKKRPIKVAFLNNEYDSNRKRYRFKTYAQALATPDTIKEPEQESQIVKPVGIKKDDS